MLPASTRLIISACLFSIACALLCLGSIMHHGYLGFLTFTPILLASLPFILFTTPNESGSFFYSLGLFLTGAALVSIIAYPLILFHYSKIQISNLFILYASALTFIGLLIFFGLTSDNDSYNQF